MWPRKRIAPVALLQAEPVLLQQSRQIRLDIRSPYCRESFEASGSEFLVLFWGVVQDRIGFEEDGGAEAARFAAKVQVLEAGKIRGKAS